MKAVVQRVTIPEGKRIICISDIHGNLDLFRRLLGKVNYSGNDVLMLLGDLFRKGKQPQETLRYIIEMSKQPNVYALRGNCDIEEEYQTAAEKAWLNRLPHIIETRDYTFVHGGLTSDDPDEQDARACMKMDAFMEQGLRFKKYVLTGHWPTINYTHGIPCCNPIIDEKSRIIAIDGGNVVKSEGQLNAFMIEENAFSYDFADDLPTIRIEKAQQASNDPLNITWVDRVIELVEDGDEICLCRHISSGRVISLPKECIWTDRDGNLCGCAKGMDYRLPVEAGDTVTVVGKYGGWTLAKKNGTVGWLDI